MQGTRVWAVIQEELTCLGATKPVHTTTREIPQAAAKAPHSRKSKITNKEI